MASTKPGGVGLLLLAAVLAAPAFAADAPAFGPAPSWVKPSSLPTPPATPDQAAVVFLLADQQVSFERGTQTTYGEIALKIQTPQGLAAGNISFPWRPETDTLTVHKVVIRRGDRVIDVLAGQKFTVLRRETNLESATLDGVLTANLQPEGLQVGDILQFATSVRSSDPVLKGHVEQVGGAWNFPIGRARLRMEWPSSLPVRIRPAGAHPAIKPVRTGATTSFELSADNVQPVFPPKGAPARYRFGRIVEATDYASWADVATLMAPLYKSAATLSAEGPLQAEVARIRRVSTNPKAQAEAALALVQEQIRYVALAMGAGGLVPANAETTWLRRYGDCKGKTALLLALLHALGIQAEPVIVSSAFGDGLDARLPMVGLFDHVLVRATIAGRTYWLDGTRTGDASLDRLATPRFGWGLPIVAEGASLVRMVPTPLDKPTQTTTIEIDATAGILSPAPIKIETILGGDEAGATKTWIATLSGETRDRALRDYWKEQYDFVDVTSATAVFDPKTGEQRLAMKGTAKLDWSGGTYDTDGTAVGYRADFSREAGAGSDAPFAVPFPYFNKMTEIIRLPRGRGEFKARPDIAVNQTVAGIEYKRNATLANDVFTIEQSERSLSPEFPAKDATTFQAILRSLANRPARLEKPRSYRATTADIAAVRATVPATSSAYFDRGLILYDDGRKTEAMLDYDKAIELDAGNVWAVANRATLKMEMNDLAGGKLDIAKAESLDPENQQVIIARGMLAEREYRTVAAIAAYTKALQRQPDRAFALGRRAFAYQMWGDPDRALEDAAAALKLDPTWIDLYWLRAQIFAVKDQTGRAIAEIDAAVRANPNRAEAYAARGRLYNGLKRPAEAVTAYDRAIALDPSSALYADRGNARAIEDTAGRKADIDTALRIQPRSTYVLLVKAWMESEAEDHKAAIATLTKAIAIEPGNVDLLSARARAYWAQRDREQALNDAAAAIRLRPDMADLYLLRANALLALGRREDAAREAVALEKARPDDAYAQVVAGNIYSRFKRHADATRAFDRALAIKPDAMIYLNRGMRRPKSDLAGRQADLDAALRLDPTMTEAVAAKAKLQADRRDFAGAVETYSAALGAKPGDFDILIGRGVAYAQAGDDARSKADFAAARSKAQTAQLLNNMCWAKATAGVALESALADCNDANLREPNMPNVLDSRALVLLRLGRLDEAIRDYDAALVKAPNQAASLFGRSIAWARKGDKAKADSDAAAAEKISSTVREEFEDFGLKR